MTTRALFGGWLVASNENVMRRLELQKKQFTSMHLQTNVPQPVTLISELRLGHTIFEFLDAAQQLILQETSFL